MKATPIHKPLKEPMQQKWVAGPVSGMIQDQYGFTIKIRERYWLFKNGIYLLQTYSLEAAKEVSLVLINDRING